MGPWMANTIRECDGLTTMMSYWTFSDVFEEQGVVKNPFYGGFGLIAERDIPKASLRAFELLHELGDQRLDNPSENAIVTRRADGTYVTAIWNYSEPGTAGTATTINLDFRGGKSTKYKIQRLNGGHGSSLDAWMRMGKPDYPTREQIAELVKASQLDPPTEHLTTDPVYLVPHELVIVQWKP
jgi:xylan 1,4-beta-xylosidase